MSVPMHTVVLRLRNSPNLTEDLYEKNGFILKPKKYEGI